MKISKIPLSHTVRGNPNLWFTPQQKKYKPKWQMPSHRFSPAFATFSPYVFSLKYESHTTTKCSHIKKTGHVIFNA